MHPVTCLISLSLYGPPSGFSSFRHVHREADAPLTDSCASFMLKEKVSTRRYPAIRLATTATILRADSYPCVLLYSGHVILVSMCVVCVDRR